ncbi:MAG: hypothetical protein H0U70_09640 [Tatlockia sp.]|nr:hypothetical protein [Tatlockia sp.]
MQVLRYWHQLEFFIPFNLDDVLSRGDSPLDIGLQNLQGEKANKMLPWLSKTQDLFHYQLYLLPFDKKELTALSTRHFPLEFELQNEIELEEKLDDEGLTCFARLFIDKKGCPQLGELSISTLPWAMGMLQSGEYGQLSEVFFERDMILLKSALKILESQYENSKSDSQPEGQFDAIMLINLLKILCQWARYSPDYPFVLKIKLIPVKNEINLPSPKPPPNSLLDKLEVDSSSQEEPGVTDDEPLDILNSFFIRDLEKTLNHLKNSDHPVLESYINGSPEKKDVQIAEYQPLLLKQLEPAQTNLGRWPAPASNLMSLMQQLCINQCFSSLSTQPVLATNGPPGTGKTTLLKDIVAENIVQRALILAGYSTVQSCFSEKRKIVMGSREVTVHLLKPDLVGFEMLVVSSNNTAVENISRELPLKSNLADDYKEVCQYLRPVAAKLAANHYQQKVHPLQPSLQPWGLIAIALGKSANRQEFIERFFFSPDGKNKSSERLKGGEYLTIWEWRDQYRGLSFEQAKINFKKAWILAENYREKLQKFAVLHEQIFGNDWTQKIAEQQLLASSLEQAIISLKDDKKSVEQALWQHEQNQNLVYREVDQQKRFKPPLWKRIFGAREARIFKKLMCNLQGRCLQLTAELLQFQEQIAQLNKQLDLKQRAHKQATEQINCYNQQQNDRKEKYRQLKLNYPTVNVPGSEISEQDQINSYWQSEEFNQLRSELFIQSLQLHQAWLAEALQKKYFGGNLFAVHALLEGTHPLASSDELAIWQSLFMVIPVVSSTFASIGRQFKNLAANTLGWLLIDEAGQAIPQAAVGALWRCKKAMVVGDPRQIEPIMSIPQHLIEGVAKHHFSSINPLWLPHITSIQRLADQASPLGSMTQQNQQQEWIGIPLLVHRRCLEPMFSVANEIAYDNKMINARMACSKSKQLPTSVWFDVEGVATDKQYVPAQGVK